MPPHQKIGFFRTHFKKNSSKMRKSASASNYGVDLPPPTLLVQSIPRDSLASDIVEQVRKAISIGKGDLSATKETLAKLSSAVEELEELLTTFKNRRDEYKNTIDALERNLPYIHLLPSNILSTIFTLSKNMLDDPEARDSPRHVRHTLALSSVCRRWRDVAAETPQLWSPLPDLALSSRRISFDVARKFIENSASESLDVGITITKSYADWNHRLPEDEDSDDEDSDDDEDDDDDDFLQKMASNEIFATLFSLLTPVVPRIRKLAIRVEDRKLPVLPMLPSNFDSLECLEFYLESASRRMDTHLRTGTPITIFANAPKLRKVNLTHFYDEPIDIPSILDFFQLPWSQITEYGGTLFPVHTMISLLQNSHLLQHFSYQIESGDPFLYNMRPGNRWTVTHNGITTLRLDCSALLPEVDESTLDEFISRLTLPSLTKLSICASNTCSMNAFSSFVSRSGFEQTLTNLELVGTAMHKTHLLPNLESFVHLSILHWEVDDRMFEFFRQLLNPRPHGTYLPEVEKIFLIWNGADPDHLRPWAEELADGRRRDEQSVKPLKMVQVDCPHCGVKELKTMFRQLDVYQGHWLYDEESGVMRLLEDAEMHIKSEDDITGEDVDALKKGLNRIRSKHHRLHPRVLLRYEDLIPRMRAVEEALARETEPLAWHLSVAFSWKQRLEDYLTGFGVNYLLSRNEENQLEISGFAWGKRNGSLGKIAITSPFLGPDLEWSLEPISNDVYW